jgi:hypothetical protein
VFSAGASPQSPLGELTALPPDPLAVLKGTASRQGMGGEGGRGRGGKGKGGEAEGRDIQPPHT